MREGDRNSKYFHASTKSRRKANQINSLQNKDGLEVDWNSGLKEVMVDYFTDLFTASETDWEEVLNCMPSRITAEQNTELLFPVERNEVRTALFHMHLEKSPGPDGMSPGFYQKFWNIVGDDIVQIVKNFLTLLGLMISWPKRTSLLYQKINI